MTAKQPLVGNGRTFRNPTQPFNQHGVLSKDHAGHPCRMPRPKQNVMPQVDLTAGLGTGVQRDSFGFSSHSVGVRRASGAVVDRATSFQGQAASSNRSTPGPGQTFRSWETCHGIHRKVKLFLGLSWSIIFGESKLGRYKGMSNLDRFILWFHV